MSALATQGVKAPPTVLRSYPRNSPQAAARVVALAMLADGNLSRSEFELLDQLAVHEQLGLPRQELQQVLHHFCEDMLLNERLVWPNSCLLGEAELAQILGAVDEPSLRVRLLNLCVQVVHADHQVTEGEAAVLLAALMTWGSADDILKPRAASQPFRH